jgi:hypothetical protein
MQQRGELSGLLTVFVQVTFRSKRHRGCCRGTVFAVPPPRWEAGNSSSSGRSVDWQVFLKIPRLYNVNRVLTRCSQGPLCLPRGDSGTASLIANVCDGENGIEASCCDRRVLGRSGTGRNACEWHRDR